VLEDDLEAGALHAQVAQFGDDAFGEMGGGLLAALAQPGRCAPDLAQQAVFLGAQLGQPLLAVSD